MKLDNEQQRELLLGAINACNFSGKMIEMIYALKLAVSTAPIEEQDVPEIDTPNGG